MKNGFLFLGLLSAGGLAGETARGAGPVSPVAVHIAWSYKDLPEGMKIYEVKPGAALWKTESVRDPTALPLKGEIADATLHLKPGQSRRFALVYQNSSKETLHFFAAPHSADPAENSLGFKFKCLCVNHAYRAAPGETWARIVEFRLAPEFQGSELTLRHVLIGIDGKRADAINKSAPLDLPHSMD